MTLGMENAGLSMRFATVVAPVAVYFLILGLLNSRRHPQVLTGRRDFALLVLALSPLLALPIINYLDSTFSAVVAMAAALGAAIWLLAPRGKTWVIYNMSIRESRRAVEAALDDIGEAFSQDGATLRLGRSDATIQFSQFPLLRNMTVRLIDGSEDLSRRFEEGLSRRVAAVTAQTSPMAVALLLVATAMIIVPLAMVAQRAPQIVRLLTDLLH